MPRGLCSRTLLVDACPTGFFIGGSEHDSNGDNDAGIDDNEESQWPDKFWEGTRRGLTEKLLNKFNFLFKAENGPPGPTSRIMLPQTLLAQDEARKAEAAADAAAKVAALAFVRERHLTKQIESADTAWLGAVHAAKVGAAQHHTTEALRALQAERVKVSKLVRLGLQDAQRAVEEPIEWKKADWMMKSKKFFTEAETLFPRVHEEIGITNTMQRRLDILVEEGRVPHGPGLFPPGGEWPDAALHAGAGGPEAAIDVLKPDPYPGTKEGNAQAEALAAPMVSAAALGVPQPYAA